MELEEEDLILEEMKALPKVDVRKRSMSRSERMEGEVSIYADRRERALSEAPPMPELEPLRLKKKDERGQAFKMKLREWDMPNDLKRVASYEYLLLVTASKNNKLRPEIMDVIDTSIRCQMAFNDDEEYTRLCDSLKLRSSLQGLDDPNLISLEYQLLLLQDVKPWVGEYKDIFRSVTEYRCWLERRLFTLIFGLRQAMLLFAKDKDKLTDGFGHKVTNELTFDHALGKVRDNLIKHVKDMEEHGSASLANKANQGQISNWLSELTKMADSLFEALDVNTNSNPGKCALNMEFPLNVSIWEQLLLLLFDEDDGEILPEAEAMISGMEHLRISMRLDNDLHHMCYAKVCFLQYCKRRQPEFLDETVKHVRESLKSTNFILSDPLVVTFFKHTMVKRIVTILRDTIAGAPHSFLDPSSVGESKGGVDDEEYIMGMDLDEIPDAVQSAIFGLMELLRVEDPFEDEDVHTLCGGSLEKYMGDARNKPSLEEQERTDLIKRSARLTFRRIQNETLMSPRSRKVETMEAREQGLNRQDVEINNICRMLDGFVDEFDEGLDAIIEYFDSSAKVNVAAVWSAETATLMHAFVDNHGVFYKDPAAEDPMRDPTEKIKLPRPYSLRNKKLTDLLQRLYTFEVQLKSMVDPAGRTTVSLNIMLWSQMTFDSFIEEEETQFGETMNRAWDMDEEKGFQPISDHQLCSSSISDVFAFFSQIIIAFFEIRLPQCLWSVRLLEVDCIEPNIYDYAEQCHNIVDYVLEPKKPVFKKNPKQKTNMWGYAVEEEEDGEMPLALCLDDVVFRKPKRREEGYPAPHNKPRRYGVETSRSPIPCSRMQQCVMLNNIQETINSLAGMKDTVIGRCSGIAETFSADAALASKVTELKNGKQIKMPDGSVKYQHDVQDEYSKAYGEDVSVFANLFKTLEATRDSMLESVANRIIFYELQEAFIDTLYTHPITATNTKLDNALDALDPIIEDVMMYLNPDLKQPFLEKLLEATVKGIKRVIFDGGPTRKFCKSHADIISRDINVVIKEFFLADGDGISEYKVNFHTDSLARNILDIFDSDTQDLIDRFNVDGFDSAEVKELIAKALLHRVKDVDGTPDDDADKFYTNVLKPRYNPRSRAGSMMS